MPIDIERIRLSADHPRSTGKLATDRKPKRTAKRGRFIRGPIPLDWIATACNLPGKAGTVGLALWFWSGLAKSDTVRISHADLRKLGVSRHAANRALHALERAQLVTVMRKPGRCPVATISLEIRRCESYDR